MDLDAFDRQLLNLLQEDADLTADQLAESVALSPSAIQRRIKRLRDRGVILRDIAVADHRKIGNPTFFIVAVEVERERPELLAQLRKWVAAQARIQQVFYVTGEADFILIITAPDTETYDALMSDLVTQNQNVRRFTTNVALSVIKRGLAVPVAEARLG
jgi:Lrp/AsnC family leucine-responsive transcriptional regulator